MSDIPSTPEGRFLRERRRRLVPRVSMRAAAERVDGVSEEVWGYTERGHVPGRDGEPPAVYRPSPEKFARMCDGLGNITPREVEEELGWAEAARLMKSYDPEGEGRPRPAHLEEPPDDDAWTYYPGDDPASRARRWIWRAMAEEGAPVHERVEAVREFDRRPSAGGSARQGTA